jgi:primosomal protein N' (replication factor Y)
MQVGGRAGRGSDPGRVLVQTYNPDSEPVRRLLGHDFPGFSRVEMERRKALGYPPFARLVGIRVEGMDAEQTGLVARRLGLLLGRKLPPASKGVRLLGPAPAPIGKIKGRTRWQLLLKGPTHASLFRMLSGVDAWVDKVPSSVKVSLDVDPGAML